MNSFLEKTLMQRIMPPQMQRMMSLVQQARQIEQNPAILPKLLQQSGMITDQQAKEIQNMGNNYEQIGQYLIQNGRIPSNYQPYENQVNQIQNMLK